MDTQTEGVEVKSFGDADARRLHPDLQGAWGPSGQPNISTRDEAVRATTDYFGGDELAATVWANKYALKDASSTLWERTPADMHWRLAGEIGRIERKYPNPMSSSEVFFLLHKFKYLVPQGSPMAGIGNDKQTVSISNCFVVGNPEGMGDSYGAIMRTDERQVQLMKRRCGVGSDLSEIRPAGTPVKNAAITSTGVVPYMERYSNSTREVAQDGRRGALMLTISSRHPDAEAFVDAKVDTTKVTGANVSLKVDDEFMEAATKGLPYEQRWPIYGAPKITKEADAKALWAKVVHNAWKSAEPGVLFWDQVLRESPADCYADEGFRTISTNPCVSGDTVVAVADGRGEVSMRELSEAGSDVPVFCLDNDNRVVVRTMRHPRVTGLAQQMYKVILDDGTVQRVTGNHKLMMRDGTYVSVRDLKPGDSVFVVFKDLLPINSNPRCKDYIWYSTCERLTRKSEHRLILEHFTDEVVPKGWVVHHIDYNAQNNRPDNLVAMSKEDHDHLHSKDMLGEKNPIHAILSDPVKGPAYRAKMAESTSGELNGRHIDVTDDRILDCTIDLAKELGRRFSRREWADRAASLGLPVSDFRKSRMGNIAHIASQLAGLEDQYHDPRLLRTRLMMEMQGYTAHIKARENGSEFVEVERECEECSKKFTVAHSGREVSFCSFTCSNLYVNRTTDTNQRRTLSINAAASALGEKNRNGQLRTFKDLEFALKRVPTFIELTEECAKREVPCRLKTKYGFKSFAELKIAAVDYNHRVVSVELDGIENVYNGTVDDFHNFMVVGAPQLNVQGKPRKSLIVNQNCGEIPLPSGDACRLLAINLYSYVKHPFTKKAEFDWELFRDHARKAQRIMDDIVDLELEKVDQILAKVESDPESADIKRVEREMWLEIRDKGARGRRTGTGVTGEGDMLAALGLKYGTKKATEFSVRVHKELAVEAYRSSAQLAKERGAFPMWDPEKERSNPFLARIKEADPELAADLEKTGRRNVALLTIAPTGTVSLMTQTTSGIECAFLVAYTRRRKVNPNDRDAKPTFVDGVGDSWEEYQVFHPHFKTWMTANGHDAEAATRMTTDELQELIKQSPYHGALSNDVDWVEKVRMQGAVQKWVDHSISVTVNLPADATEALVNDVYVTAWRSGCKGCTVYRDGCRTGVLVKKDDPATAAVALFGDTSAPKRPKRLDCTVTRFTNNGERWIGLVGLLDGRPYELFTGHLDNFPVPGYVERGEIVKEKAEGRSSYHFVYTDRSGSEIRLPNLNHAFDVGYYDLARTLSAILRHGMPLPYVVDLLEGLKLDGDLVSTWKAGVKRMLKRYIKDGTTVSGKTCSECGSASLEYKEGCVSCSSCGSSKCG